MEPFASRGLDTLRPEVGLFGASEVVFEKVNERGFVPDNYSINEFEIGKFIGDPTLNQLGVTFLGADD